MSIIYYCPIDVRARNKRRQPTAQQPSSPAAAATTTTTTMTGEHVAWSNNYAGNDGQLLLPPASCSMCVGKTLFGAYVSVCVFVVHHDILIWREKVCSREADALATR